VAESGVLVVSVESGSPAQKAGILPGDVIIEFGGHPVAAIDDLHRLLTESQVHVGSAITIIRNQEKRVIDVIPEEAPAVEGE
jgi:S1-C subfamily serine protease